MNKNVKIMRRSQLSAVILSTLIVAGCGPKEPAYATQAEVEEIRNEVLQSTATNAEKLQSTEYNSRTFVGNIEELQFQISDLQRQVAALEKEVTALRQGQDPQSAAYNTSPNAMTDALGQPVPQPVNSPSTSFPSVTVPSDANTTAGSNDLPLIGGDGDVMAMPSGDDGANGISNSMGSDNATDTPVITIDPANPSADNAMAMDESPEQIYQRAFEALRVGEVDTAITDLNVIATKYPEHDYADDSLYWIGEAEYISNNFDASKTAFNRLLKEYPSADQSPDALLRLGMIEAEQGNAVQAEQYFTRVISDYPNSRAGMSAQNQLSQLTLPTTPN